MQLTMAPLILALFTILAPIPGDAEVLLPGTSIDAVSGDGLRLAGGKQFQNWRRHRYQDNRGRHFVPPSIAAKRAQQRYGGKVLGVHLFEGIYLVKLRGKGKVWVVRIHAVSGRIIGP